MHVGGLSALRAMRTGDGGAAVQAALRLVGGRGQLVARLEVELILTALLKRVDAIELTAEPVRKLNNTLRSIGSLPVEFKALAV